METLVAESANGISKGGEIAVIVIGVIIAISVLAFTISYFSSLGKRIRFIESKENGNTYKLAKAKEKNLRKAKKHQEKINQINHLKDEANKR